MIKLTVVRSPAGEKAPVSRLQHEQQSYALAHEPCRECAGVHIAQDRDGKKLEHANPISNMPSAKVIAIAFDSSIHP